MAGRRTLERERYWRGVIRKHRASGLSVSAFCRKDGLSACSFYRWRRKLEKQQQEEKDSPHNEEDACEDSTGTDTVAKFVPIEVQAPRNSTRAGCEVVLPSGCRVVVSAQCDAAWLCEILGALQERAC